MRANGNFSDANLERLHSVNITATLWRSKGSPERNLLGGGTFKHDMWPWSE